MKLPYTEVKFHPEVKSQTGLSSLWVSCKRALSLTKTYITVITKEIFSAEKKTKLVWE